MRSRPITSRHGTTLIEGLMASVLLATSVVGISGSLVAAYQNQASLQLRREATGTGRSVMEAVTALPMDSASASSLATYQAKSAGSNSAQATATLNLLGLVGATASNTGASVVADADPLLGSVLPGVNLSLVVGGTDAAASNPDATGVRPPSVLVERRAGLTGATNASGDFALVTVTVPTDGKQAPVKFKRLVTSVEAAANQTK